MMYNPNFTGWPGFASPMQGFGGGGWGGGGPQMMHGFGPPMGWGQAPQQAAPENPDVGQLPQMKTQLDRMRTRAAAGTGDQTKLQGRIDSLQGRVRDARQARRQGNAQPAGGAQPEPGMGQNFAQYLMGGPQMGGAAMWGGGRPQGYDGMQQGFGMNPYQMGGMQNWMQPMNGGYNPQQGMSGQMPQGANRPGMQYRQDRRQARQGAEAAPGANPGSPPVAPQQPQQGGWNPGTTPTGMGNMFETQFGRLVPSSVGNQNVFQRENDPNTLYSYNPQQGWKSMTPDEYRGYGETNYADPRQFGAAANPMMQQWQKNASGMWAGKVGTGSYA